MSDKTMRKGLLALLTSASAGAIMSAAPAGAQEVETIPERTADEIEERTGDVVVVTGSRIRRDEFSSPGPVQVIDPRLGELQGTIDAAALIQSSSVASGSAQTTSAISSNFVTNGGAGAATVSLRGLGAERTLVLLNSRRAGPAGTRGAVSSFDLNVLPTSIIDNIEILKDGASSIYGSDAVAGVVNIITKRDTDGIEFDFFGSQPLDSGGEEYRASATWGKTFDRGHILTSFDYYKRKELARGDRPKYLECGEERIFDSPGGNRVDLIDPRTGNYKCSDDLPWGHIWIYDLHYYDYGYGYTTNPGSNIPGSGPGVVTKFQYNYAGDNLQDYIPALAPPRDGSDLTVPEGFFPVEYDPISYALFNQQSPFIPEVTVIPETTRYTAYLDAAFEITDNVEVYGEFLFNRRETYQNSWVQFWDFSLTSAPGSIEFFGAGPNPFNPATGPYLTSSTPITNHADASQQVDYFRGVGGFRGEFEGGFLNNWAWDIYSQYSRSKGLYRNDQIYKDSIDYQYAIGYGYFPDGCEGFVTPVSQKECVTIDWWDPELLRGNIPQNVRDYLFGTEEGKTIYTQAYVEAILTGNLIELPAGQLGAAFGATYRRDSLNDLPGDITYAENPFYDPSDPDSDPFINNSWTGSASGNTVGTSKTMEFFGELSIPLLRDLPGIQYFEVGVAGRYTDVNTVEDTAQTWKISANWVVTDWLRIGGTMGTSFRAPALFELYLADQTYFEGQRVIEPCAGWGEALARGDISQQLADNCAAEGVPPNYTAGAISSTIITRGGLGELEPETSKAKTASVTVFLDPILPESTRASIRADYFDIEVNGEIAQLGPANILFGCLSSEFYPNDPLCDLYERNGQGNVNSIATVTDQFINVNSQINRGLDFTVRLDQQLPGNWGDLQIMSQMTLQLKDTIELFEGTVENVNGEEGEPKLTGDLNIRWDKNDWSFLWSIDYVGRTSDLDDFREESGLDSACGVTDILHDGPYCVDVVAERTIYHSVSMSKTFDDEKFTVILGVANLFDQEPPRVSEYGANFSSITNLGAVPYHSQYDFVGRRVFLNLTAAF
ncbi:TonB-dependent receptor domain-containing protein [Hyphococcus sp.]|uniref:TonB-dependent receptor domain-containing protein n=1 Tax=Hyphococcus sp. TaxID=2038636 RepID=UPI003D0BAE05